MESRRNNTKTHSVDETYDICSSPNTISIVKLRKVSLAKHATRKEEKRFAATGLWL